MKRSAAARSKPPPLDVAELDGAITSFRAAATQTERSKLNAVIVGDLLVSVNGQRCNSGLRNSILRLPAPRPHERRPSRGLVFRGFPDQLEGPFGGSYEEWALKTAWSRQELGT